MEIKKEINSNRSFALKKVAINFIISVVVLFFIFLIGNSVNPELINFKNKFVTINVIQIALLYISINSFKYYKSILENLNLGSLIDENRRKGHPIILIKQRLAQNELFIEEYKEKLNLIKAYSPIPIIIFLIGLFLNKGFVINLDLVKSINLESIKIFQGELFVMLGIGFYFLKLRATWLKYKLLLRIVSKYKNELIYLESEKYKEDLSYRESVQNKHRQERVKDRHKY
ncbi:hypothetical protein [Peribacillus frigoritolerans]|uniref:hypothetical protein n=1 Tax=Peribacillus frigoritolerans TaxID=450367 RepID=UPI0020C13B7F|nr:hypothetical protein [Peribacillus frigoritolerans]MEE3951640.1 hypothetical protein [Peribacillus frigoritolerans]